MFSAIAYQLASIGLSDIDAHMLRTMLVSHSEDNLHVNGTHYSTFLSAPVMTHIMLIQRHLLLRTSTYQQ